MSPSARQQCLAWWQLLRIGNVFTAVSNVIAGFLIVQGSWQPLGPLLWLIAASAFLYSAGMVLNDAFDAELDAAERPERPIPSGRIALQSASRVGWALLFLGVLAGGWAGYLVGNERPTLVAAGLALCVVGYDAGLKATVLGPWVMGACRLLNVMLGAYGAAATWQTDAVWYALAIACYTIGLTYFAQQENIFGWKFYNSVGAAMVVVATLFVSLQTGKAMGSQILFWVSCVALNLFLWLGLLSPLDKGVSSEALRGAIGRIIKGFILLDALIVSSTVGPLAGLVVLSLIIPTWIASRFAPMT